MQHTNFNQLLNGYFEGILRWSQLDDLWQQLKQSDAEWFVYQIGSPIPQQPLTTAELHKSIDELNALLRQEHEYDYCGIVYANDIKNPTLIKVYDPNNLGSSCGCGGDKIPPRWIISQQQPEEIIDDAPTPANRKRWWSRLFS